MKTETIADFLARGGKITRVETPSPTAKSDSIKSTSAGGPPAVMTMDDADLYYGEHKQRKAKKKSTAGTIDLSMLPPELKKMFVDDVINAEKDDEDEED